jgi:hypothetical protein
VYTELEYLVLIKACEAGKDFLERVRGWAAEKNDGIVEDAQEVELMKNVNGQTNERVLEAVYQEVINIQEKKDIQKVDLMKKNANKDAKEMDTIAQNILNIQKKTIAEQAVAYPNEDDTSSMDFNPSETPMEGSLIIV